MKRTTLIGNERNSENEKDDKEDSNPEVLIKVMELLDDKEVIGRIMGTFDKDNETKEEYIKNRATRIDMLLEAAGTNEKEYIKAIQCANKKGYTVLLARDIDEGYINPFVPEWLEAWDGNVDCQPCFDFFGVITYVTDYLTKDDTGVVNMAALI